MSKFLDKPFKYFLTNKTAKSNGRPKIEIDFEALEQLCRIQCTLEEIAGVFRCSEDTIERRVKEKSGLTFAEYYKQFSSDGKMSLRREQMRQALVLGNVKMLVFLGKQYLNQADKIDGNNTNKNINLNSNIDLSDLSDNELDQEIADLNDLADNIDQDFNIDEINVFDD